MSADDASPAGVDASDVPLVQREVGDAESPDELGHLAASLRTGSASRSVSLPAGKAGAQRARILEAMRERGWITARDFRWPTVDGGPEIHNITPRVSELRKRHQIETDLRGPGGIARYRLVWDRGDDAEPIRDLVDEAAAGDEDRSDQLALELPTPSPGMYDVDEAA